MNLKAVLKIGGSLSRGKGLSALCREVGRLGELYPLLIVPGGGDFAEQVRETDRRFHLDRIAAHRMAVLAMDQYGYLLNQLIPGSCLTADLAQGCNLAECCKPAVLLPSALIFREDPLPHSWEVTSDSIAAWISSRVGCGPLILLKDVDGLLTAGQLITDLTPEQLSGHSGGVDEYLSRVLNSTQIETWIINGLHPGRLSELLETGHTVGTRVFTDRHGSP